MSNWTGPPNAWARALGLNDDTKGTAVATTPAPPVTRVATVKKCRRVKPVLSATEHPLTSGAKHQEASLKQLWYPIQSARRTSSRVRRMFGTFSKRLIIHSAETA